MDTKKKGGRGKKRTKKKRGKKGGKKRKRKTGQAQRMTGKKDVIVQGEVH